MQAIVYSLALVLLVGLLIANTPPARSETAVAAAIAQGKAVVGMNESDVIRVWGPPDAIRESNVLSLGWFSPIEEYYWTYYTPYRQLTFKHERGSEERVTKIDNQ
jgi:hypothetical protein